MTRTATFASLTALLLSGCFGSSEPIVQQEAPPTPSPPAANTLSSQPPPPTRKPSRSELLEQSEANASPNGRAVLHTGRRMVEDKVIIRGGCWNYIDNVYKRAGFTQGKGRKMIYQSKKGGPYADIAQIEPGDWIYHINHSYHGQEHSGIFVGWLNYPKKTAMMLSYGGERRREPARYRPYDLSSVYTIIRPKEK